MYVVLMSLAALVVDADADDASPSGQELENQAHPFEAIFLLLPALSIDGCISRDNITVGTNHCSECLFLVQTMQKAAAGLQECVVMPLIVEGRPEVHIKIIGDDGEIRFLRFRSDFESRT